MRRSLPEPACTPLDPTFADDDRSPLITTSHAVITSLSRRRVMVSEWVTGARFDEILTLDQEQRAVAPPALLTSDAAASLGEHSR